MKASIGLLKGWLYTVSTVMCWDVRKVDGGSVAKPDHLWWRAASISAVGSAVQENRWAFQGHSICWLHGKLWHWPSVIFSWNKRT